MLEQITIMDQTNESSIPIPEQTKRGRRVGSTNLHAKHPSSLARRLKAAGLDWVTDFALAIKGRDRERIAMWLRLLPYLVTTTNKLRVKRWKGKASKAALVALDALEGK